MNKIFKLVFNRVRGCVMVVNELTSSWQTGKKAATTVAVATTMLASGVVMASDTATTTDWILQEHGFNIVKEHEGVEDVMHYFVGGNFVNHHHDDPNSALSYVPNNSYDRYGDHVIHTEADFGKFNTEGDTIVSLTGGQIADQLDETTNRLEIYGGGLVFGQSENSYSDVVSNEIRDNYNSAIVGGSTYVTLKNFTAEDLPFADMSINVFGGGNIGGHIDTSVGNANVVGDTNVLIENIQNPHLGIVGGGEAMGSDWIDEYGQLHVVGNSTATVGGTTNVTVSNSIIESVSGGGEASGTNANASVGATKIVITNTVVDDGESEESDGSVFGGGYADFKAVADVKGDVSIEMTESSSAYVFGGGITVFTEDDKQPGYYGTSAKVEGRVVIDLDASNVDLLVAGGTTHGGWLGLDSDLAPEIPEDSEYSTNNGIRPVDGLLGDASVGGDVTVTLKNGSSVGEIYMAGYGKGSDVEGNATLVVADNTVTIGKAYGQGFQAEVKGTSSLVFGTNTAGYVGNGIDFSGFDVVEATAGSQVALDFTNANTSELTLYGEGTFVGDVNLSANHGLIVAGNLETSSLLLSDKAYLRQVDGTVLLNGVIDIQKTSSTVVEDQAYTIRGIRQNGGQMTISTQGEDFNIEVQAYGNPDWITYLNGSVNTVVEHPESFAIALDIRGDLVVETAPDAMEGLHAKLTSRVEGGYAYGLRLSEEADVQWGGDELTIKSEGIDGNALGIQSTGNSFAVFNAVVNIDANSTGGFFAKGIRLRNKGEAPAGELIFNENVNVTAKATDNGMVQGVHLQASESPYVENDTGAVLTFNKNLTINVTTLGGKDAPTNGAYTAFATGIDANATNWIEYGMAPTAEVNVNGLLDIFASSETAEAYGIRARNGGVVNIHGGEIEAISESQDSLAYGIHITHYSEVTNEGNLIVTSQGSNCVVGVAAEGAFESRGDISISAIRANAQNPDVTPDSGWANYAFTLTNHSTTILDGESISLTAQSTGEFGSALVTRNHANLTLGSAENQTVVSMRAYGYDGSSAGAFWTGEVNQNGVMTVNGSKLDLYAETDTNGVNTMTVGGGSTAVINSTNTVIGAKSESATARGIRNQSMYNVAKNKYLAAGDLKFNGNVSITANSAQGEAVGILNRAFKAIDKTENDVGALTSIEGTLSIVANSKNNHTVGIRADGFYQPGDATVDLEAAKASVVTVSGVATVIANGISEGIEESISFNSDNSVGLYSQNGGEIHLLANGNTLQVSDELAAVGVRVKSGLVELGSSSIETTSNTLAVGVSISDGGSLVLNDALTVNANSAQESVGLRLKDVNSIVTFNKGDSTIVAKKALESVGTVDIAPDAKVTLEGSISLEEGSVIKVADKSQLTVTNNVESTIIGAINASMEIGDDVDELATPYTGKLSFSGGEMTVAETGRIGANTLTLSDITVYNSGGVIITESIRLGQGAIWHQSDGAEFRSNTFYFGEGSEYISADEDDSGTTLVLDNDQTLYLQGGHLYVKNPTTSTKTAYANIGLDEDNSTIYIENKYQYEGISVNNTTANLIVQKGTALVEVDRLDVTSGMLTVQDGATVTVGDLTNTGAITIEGATVTADTVDLTSTVTLKTNGFLTTYTDQIFTTALNSDGTNEDAGSLTTSGENIVFAGGTLAFNDAYYNLIYAQSASALYGEGNTLVFNGSLVDISKPELPENTVLYEDLTDDKTLILAGIDTVVGYESPETAFDIDKSFGVSSILMGQTFNKLTIGAGNQVTLVGGTDKDLINFADSANAEVVVKGTLAIGVEGTDDNAGQLLTNVTVSGEDAQLTVGFGDYVFGDVITNNGNVSITSGVADFNSVTINAGSMNVAMGSSVTIESLVAGGTIENNGMLTSTEIAIEGNGQLTNSNELTATNIEVKLGQLTNIGSMSVTDDLEVVNGLVTNNADATLTVGGALSVTGGTLMNNGTIESGDTVIDGTFVMEAKATNNGQWTTDTLDVISGTFDNAGSLTVESDMTTTDSNVTNESGKTMMIMGDLTIDGGTFVNYGTLNANYTTVEGDAEVTNNSTWGADNIEVAGGTFTNKNTVAVTDTLMVAGGTFTNDGQITIGAVLEVRDGHYTNNATTNVTDDVSVAFGAKIENNDQMTADSIELEGDLVNAGTLIVTNTIKAQGAAIENTNDLTAKNFVVNDSVVVNYGNVSVTDTIVLATGSAWYQDEGATMDAQKVYWQTGSNYVETRADATDTTLTISGRTDYLQGGAFSIVDSEGVETSFTDLKVTDNANTFVEAEYGFDTVAVNNGTLTVRSDSALLEADSLTITAGNLDVTDNGRVEVSELTSNGTITISNGGHVVADKVDFNDSVTLSMGGFLTTYTNQIFTQALNEFGSNRSPSSLTDSGNNIVFDGGTLAFNDAYYNLTYAQNASNLFGEGNTLVFNGTLYTGPLTSDNGIVLDDLADDATIILAKVDALVGFDSTDTSFELNKSIGVSSIVMGETFNQLTIGSGTQVTLVGGENKDLVSFVDMANSQVVVDGVLTIGHEGVTDGTGSLMSDVTVHGEDASLTIGYGDYDFGDVTSHGGSITVTNGTVGFKNVALNGGAMDIASGSVTMDQLQTSGEFANAGTLSVTTDMTVSGGLVTNAQVGSTTVNGDFKFTAGEFTNNGTFNTSNAFINGETATMNNQGTWNTTDLDLALGTLNNSGTLTVTKSVDVTGGLFSNTGDVTITQELTITGGEVANATDAEMTVNGAMQLTGGEFTNDGLLSTATVTIDGEEVSMVNNGTWNATSINLVSGTLTNTDSVTTSGEVSMSAGSLSNSGTMTVNGELAVMDGTITNDGALTVTKSVDLTGGLFNNFGDVTITQGLTITGGEVANATDAEMTVEGALELTGGEITNNGKLSTGNTVIDATVDHNATLVNAGTWDASSIDLVFGTLTNSATLTTTGKVIVAGGLLTNATGASMTVDGTLGIAGGKFENDSVLNTADVAIDATASGDASFVNDGTWNATNIGVANGTLMNNYGLTTTGRLMLAEGEVTNTVGATMTVGGELLVAGGTFTNSGTLTTGDAMLDGESEAQAIVNNNGVWEASKLGLVNAQLTNAGSMSVTSTIHVGENAFFSNTEVASITVTDALSVDGGEVDNDGTMEVGGALTLANGTFTNDGVLTTSASLISGRDAYMVNTEGATWTTSDLSIEDSRYVNSGEMNVSAFFEMSSGSVTNEVTGTMTVGDQLLNLGGDIVNKGELNTLAGGAFGTIADGVGYAQSAGSVTNDGTWNASHIATTSGNLTNTGTMMATEMTLIDTTASNTSAMTVTGTLGTYDTTMTNIGTLTAGNTVIHRDSIFTNESILDTDELRVTNAQLTNTGALTVGGDFTITSSILTNSGTIVTSDAVLTGKTSAKSGINLEAGSLTVDSLTVKHATVTNKAEVNVNGSFTLETGAVWDDSQSTGVNASNYVWEEGSTYKMALSEVANQTLSFANQTHSLLGGAFVGVMSNGTEVSFNALSVGTGADVTVGGDYSFGALDVVGTLTVGKGGVMNVTTLSNNGTISIANGGQVTASELAFDANVELGYRGVLTTYSNQIFVDGLNDEGTNINPQGKTANADKIVFAGGTLAINDATYNLIYAQSAADMMGSGARLVFNGELNFADDVQPDTPVDIGLIGDSPNLVMGNLDVEINSYAGETEATIDKSVGVSSIAVQEGIDKVTLETGNTLTLVGGIDENGNAKELISFAPTESGQTPEVAVSGQLQIGQEGATNNNGTLSTKVTLNGEDAQLNVGHGQYEIADVQSTGGSIVVTESETTFKKVELQEGANMQLASGQYKVEEVQAKGSTIEVAEADVSFGKVHLLDGSVLDNQSSQVSINEVLVGDTDDEVRHSVNVIGAYDVTTLNGNANSVLNIGTSGEDGQRGDLTLGETSDLNGMTVFLDPVWNGGTLADASRLVHENTSVNGKIVVGENSYVVLGGPEDNEFRSVFDKKLTWGKDTLAAAYVAKPITIDSSTGALYLDGTLSALPNTSIKAGSVTFKGTSVLVANATNAAGKTLITADSFAIDDTAKAVIVGVLEEGKNYQLTNLPAWDADQVMMGNALWNLNFKTEDGSFRVQLQQANDVFGDLMQGSDLADKGMSAGGETEKWVDGLLTDTSGNVNVQASVAAQFDAAMNPAGALATYSTAYDRAGELRQVVREESATANTSRLWARVTSSNNALTELSTGAQALDVDTNAYGLVIGGETKLDSMSIGMALTAGSGDSENKDVVAKDDFTYYGVSVYGKTKFGSVDVLADASVTMLNSDLTVGGKANVNTETDTTVISMGVQAQKTFALNSLNVTPFVGFDVYHVRADGYENGHGAKVGKADATAVEVPIGVTIAKGFETASGMKIDPSFTFAVAPTLTGGDINSQVKFAGAENTYKFKFADDVKVRSKLGINATKKNFTFGVSAGYEWGSEGRGSTSIQANMKYMF